MAGRKIELPAQDKRACQRLEAAFPVNITIKGRANNNENNLCGQTVDLSEKGAGLALNSLLPLSSIVDMYINASPPLPTLPDRSRNTLE